MSYLTANPEDRFSRDAARIVNKHINIVRPFTPYARNPKQKDAILNAKRNATLCLTSDYRTSNEHIFRIFAPHERLINESS